eukprot:8830374-Lingulodinium_polyedra.AAC.1
MPFQLWLHVEFPQQWPNHGEEEGKHHVCTCRPKTAGTTWACSGPFGVEPATPQPLDEIGP